ncbi:kinase-like domain-containing protein [Mucidula mucida]|nr:kinase-like domain-containing protein [Mucidula mucida]
MVQLEGYWFQHQPFLHHSGYILRSKFRPDSGWLKLSENEKIHHRDDGAIYPKPYIMDATRAHDGKPVMLKALSTKRSTKELEIALFFSAPERKDEPQNHCVPVWDVLQSPFDQDSQIIVMPRLYEIDEPIFDTVGEALDCTRQTFEGLEYMHRHHVAHKDITVLNIMMDARDLYPHGHHPVHTWATAPHTDIAKHLTRTHIWPRYYIIDFDRSQRFDTGSIPAALTTPVSPPSIQFYPENRHNRRGFFNPFPADVYALASVLTNNLTFVSIILPLMRPIHIVIDLQNYYRGSMNFLRPLWDSMLCEDPVLRPTMSEALEHLTLLCTPLPSRCRLRMPVYSTNIRQQYRQVCHLLRGRRALPYDTFPLTTGAQIDFKERAFLRAKPLDREPEVSEIQ